jgi:thymidylate kinase
VVPELSTSFVSITGPGAGAGKSTLAAALAGSLRGDGVHVRSIPENWFFEWPAYTDLAERFHERRYPSADDLLAAFDRLRGDVGPGALWVQEWSWIDLAEDLPWAERDDDALARFSAELAHRAADLRPMILYLAVDPEIAVRRAVVQRGEAWFKRPINDVVRDCTARESRLLRAIASGAWMVHHLDAARSIDDVLRAALAVVTSSGGA